MPIIKKDGRSIGIRPKRLKIEYGSGSDKSLIHPKMEHVSFQLLQQTLYKAKDWNL